MTKLFHKQNHFTTWYSASFAPKFSTFPFLRIVVLTHSNCVIFTDSKCLVGKLKTTKKFIKINNLLQQILTKYGEFLRTRKSLEIVCIRGHMDIQQNKIVDHKQSWPLHHEELWTKISNLKPVYIQNKKPLNKNGQAYMKFRLLETPINKYN